MPCFILFIPLKGTFRFEDYISDGKINDWLRALFQKGNKIIGKLHSNGNDFQHQVGVFFDNDTKPKTFGGLHLEVNENNLIACSVLYSSRHCMEATWLNDRDQFLYPNDGWQTDTEFQNDCLAFTLFYGQNRITSQEGVNHWIPFTEQEVNAQEPFKSHFLTDFISGKVLRTPLPQQPSLFCHSDQTKCVEESKKSLAEIPHFVRNDKGNEKLIFSKEATAVFNAGRELWRYYHAQPNANPNASLYDIREHFQGRSVAPTGNNKKGRMNNKSDDPHYTELIATLRERLKILASKISDKVYEYEFLRR